MPSEEQLEYEITLARNDLEQNLQELQVVVREKLDVRKRAREVYEQAKAKARSLVTRNVAIAAALISVVGGIWFGRRHA